MSFPHRSWWSIAAAAVLVTGILTGVHRYQHRFVRSNEDLLRLLPRRTDASVLFADLAVLRAGGYLSLLEEATPKQEQQYTEFVRGTGFDYTRDLDTAVGEMAEGQLWFALRGRFRWKQIRGYVTSHGGNCASDFCTTAASTPGRSITFRAIQPDVMALAVAAGSEAAELVRAGQNPSPFLFDAPVWMRPSQALLRDPATLPVALRIFAISLQSADSVVLALKSSDAADTSFAVTLEALFRNEPTAETAKNQLEIDTRMLTIELRRERRKPDPGDVAGLLTSGTFQVLGRRLVGTWPVHKQLIHSLQ